MRSCVVVCRPHFPVLLLIKQLAARLTLEQPMRPVAERRKS